MDLGRLAFEGRIGRRAFVAAGGALLGLKLLVDAAISAGFGEPWTPLIYLSPRVSPLLHPREAPVYWLVLAVAALPFIVLGLRLCAARLRDVGVNPLWCGVFFAPFIHYVFFVVLAAVPSAEDRTKGSPPSGPKPDAAADPPLFPALARLVPESAAGRRLLAIVGSFLIAGVATGAVLALPRTGSAPPFLSKEVLGTGVFFGVPFGIGFWSAFVVSYRRPSSSAGPALLTAFVSFLALLITLVAIALEGAACIVMATPILGVVTLMGAIVGHLSARLPKSEVALGAALVLVAFLLGDDFVRPPEAAPLVAVTEVRVAAAPEVVWSRVTSSTVYDEPPAPLFAICAMPLAARYEGTGVGAKRTCALTVGDVHETIVTWNERRALAWTADSAPERFDRYGSLERGAIELLKNDDGTTTLRGTTWYRLRVAPVAYWSFWTQAFVHATHERVFAHLKRLAEHPDAPASASPAAVPPWMASVNATCACTRHAPER
jgi:uncharacterized membrane protein YhaH (DUF805 family)